MQRILLSTLGARTSIHPWHGKEYSMQQMLNVKLNIQWTRSFEKPLIPSEKIKAPDLGTGQKISSWISVYVNWCYFTMVISQRHCICKIGWFKLSFLLAVKAACEVPFHFVYIWCGFWFTSAHLVYFCTAGAVRKGAGSRSHNRVPSEMLSILIWSSGTTLPWVGAKLIIMFPRSEKGLKEIGREFLILGQCMSSSHNT